MAKKSLSLSVSQFGFRGEITEEDLFSVRGAPLPKTFRGGTCDFCGKESPDGYAVNTESATYCSTKCHVQAIIQSGKSEEKDGD